MVKLLLCKPTLDFFFAPGTNKLFVTSRSQSKIYFFYLPSFFYYKPLSTTKRLQLFFVNHFSYTSFLAHLFNCLSKLSSVFFLKLKIKGLGYRIRRYAKALYRFYFTRTNYIYFHVPVNVIVRRRKKRLLLISSDYALVRLVFAHLMLLHTVGPYNRRGFSYPRQIVFLKPKKKIV